MGKKNYVIFNNTKVFFICLTLYRNSYKHRVVMTNSVYCRTEQEITEVLDIIESINEKLSGKSEAKLQFESKMEEPKIIIELFGKQGNIPIQSYAIDFYGQFRSNCEIDRRIDNNSFYTKLLKIIENKETTKVLV